MRRLRSAHHRIFDAAPTRAHWQRPLWQQLNDAYAMLAHETMEVLAAEAGLSLRRPYWSRRAVEYSISLPRRVLNRPGHNRSLHREAMAALLPPQVLQREDKAEFSYPFRSLTAELAAVLRTSLSPALAARLQGEPFDRRLEMALAAPPGTADWALWFLFSAAVALKRADVPIV